VSTMSAADAWQQTGRPADRSYPSGRAPRLDRDGHGEYSPRRRPDVPPVPRSRPDDRSRPAARPERRPASGQSGEFPRPEHGREEVRRPAGAARGATAAPGRRPVAAETGGSRLRGILAVLGVFLLTLAGAGIDSFLGVGLGTVTLVALVGSSVLATLLVRRRDVVSVMVSPPLIFVAVALVDVVLAPSARFSLPTLATLLIRGFPAMGIATGAALVIGLVRLVSRRR